MRRRMVKSATPTHLLSSALEVRDFAERLPERATAFSMRWPPTICG